MPAGAWKSRPDIDKATFGHFETSMISDDFTRGIFERIRFELEQLNRGCEKPIHGLRAHCWMPDVTRRKYGYYMAGFNEMVLSANWTGPNIEIAASSLKLFAVQKCDKMARIENRK